MNEVHVYLAEGEALNSGDSIRPIGEVHPLIIFIKQELNSEHDLELCAEEARKIGWGSLQIKKAGTVKNLESIRSKGEEYMDAYETAMSEGSFVIVVGGIFNKNS